MRVLVTGGAGYLGSVMVPCLLRAGHRVTVLDSFMYGQASLLDVCHEGGLRVVRGNALDRGVLAGLVREADALIPLAAYTGAPLCAREPEAARAVNLDAVRLLLELKGRDQALVFPNTNSGYGTGQGDLPCTEEMSLRPVSLYGRLKTEAEFAVREAANTVVFRLATVFGPSPRMRIDLLVNDFTYRAVTDGFVVLFEAHFKRNYVHVRDVARAFLHALDHVDTMRGEAFNLGLSDANLSKLELCELIRREVPGFTIVESDVGQDPDRRNYVVSNAKLETAGFRAETSLATGVRELLNAYAIVRRNAYGNV